MIKNVKKIPVLRYGLIVLLVCILFSGAFYLYIRYNGARKLQANINTLITARQNSELIDSCLITLYDADNNSRLYAVTGDKKYILLFADQINSLNDLLGRVRIGEASVAADTGQFKTLIAEKTDKTNNYVKLRLYTDSLIHLGSKINFMLARTQIKVPGTTTKTIKTTEHLDTIKPAAGTPPKKFLGRVFSVVTGHKKQPETIVVKRDTQIQTIVNTASVYAPIPKKERNYYQKINAANNTLKDDERKILLINNNLIGDIITELKRHKVLEQSYATNTKRKLAIGVGDVFNEYSSLSKLTLISLLLLVMVVLYNIWKIFSNQRDIINYSEKAEEYADNKSRFMASMSHEIRTPLNSVIGFAEQLGMSKLGPEQTLQVNAIRSSSRMLLDVVNEVLDFSKYVTGKMTFEQQPFMLYKNMNDVFNSVSIQAAKKELLFRKSFNFDEDTCVVGDAMRLKQVVINLLVNAIKFTPAGEVSLEMSLNKLPTGKAMLKAKIKDSGIGIKKENLPIIFDEFAQVSDAQKVTQHKGTGLGLAICKKIVELQGGNIRAVSEPGKGSIFLFEIPFELIGKEACVDEQAISDDQLITQVTGAHVLLADDNQLNVLLAKTILKKWNISCDVAGDGQQAYNLFAEKKFDMVLTDIEMPIMGGLELLAAIRKDASSLKAETPVIVLTANVLKEDRDRYFSAGANEIVLKPFNERNLIEKISSVLKNKYASIDNLLVKYEE